MENISSESPLSPEQELALAQQRVADARRKLDLLEEARLQKLRQDIADATAAEERRLFQQAEEKRLIEQRWLERRRAEEQKAEADRRAKETAQRELEQSLAKAEEEQRLRQEHDREVARLANEAHLLELEARRREAELRATPEQDAEATTPQMSGRDLLFERLTKPASRFDGQDGHSETPVAIAPCTATESEDKQ